MQKDAPFGNLIRRGPLDGLGERMAFVWNWMTAPAFLAALVGFVFAAVVYMARPARLQNRALALTLAFEGIMMLCGSGLMYVTTDPRSAYAWQLVTFVAGSLGLGMYLLFLTTLEAPSFRVFNKTAVRVVIVLASILLALLVIARPERFVIGIEPFGTSGSWDVVTGPWVPPLILAYFLGASLIGVVVSLNAFYTAPHGSAQRKRAGAYALAFGVRDVAYGAVFAALTVGLLQGVVWIVAPTLVPLLYLPIVAYGILRSQLFDIDLRIKWSIRQSTVAGAFVVVFFIVTELAQQIFSEQIGPYLGIAAAGALLFALAPLQRFAERLSDKAMPSVNDTQEYRTVRKRDVYRAAFESANIDGVLTEKERDVLATLADQLGLSAGDARAIERETAA